MLRSQPHRSFHSTFQTLSKLAALILILLGLWLSQPLASWAEAPADPEAEVTKPTLNHSGLDTDAISPEKVSQFIRAYLHVVNLIEQREGELQGAETDAESLRIQQDIEAEALSLIESEGLTLQEYMQLLSLANLDPEFGDRIALQLQEAID
ncbi:MAG: DUF4168 domain-containing protein [Oscillatoriophycideae cyanobacterium NC_groundwater_1537_Pr4_S-0.65um_50_18]|nr:DUF4168 domain-containing protein [Oscillatoriophycideae cyanobacterium NC_groundwater_1537_Pr4_S-0.65um_50_18]